VITTNAPHAPFIVDDRYSEPYLGQVVSRDRAEFYGMITCIDDNLGILRHRLMEWGLAENTILVFMTDNGTAGGVTVDEEQFVVDGYNAGMRGKKGSEYDGGHRVPLFIHWPAGGLDQGRDIVPLTANVDMMPTLLELCGIETDRTFDGRSLVSLLRDEGADWPDRIMVTDSQRLAHPVKWRKSATMTSQWRLINGEELYDMTQDPGQRENVAADHPEVLARLRAGYERWWAKVSTQFDGTIPLTLGAKVGEPTLLNSHDWRNDPVECAWNQSQVREGLVANGYWEVDVAAPGRYRFELRRWPRVEDRPLSEGIPGAVVAYYNLRTHYGGGRAIPVERARLRVGNWADEVAVNPEDHVAVFEMTLQAGETQVQTWFEVEEGPAIGAYFVYVERMSPA
jgi:arylsulfatase B